MDEPIKPIPHDELETMTRLACRTALLERIAALVRADQDTVSSTVGFCASALIRQAAVALAALDGHT